MSFHNVYNFFFLSLQTIAIAHLFYGSKAICEKFALIVQWIERRFPKPLIRVRFPVGVLNINSFPLIVKSKEADYHFYIDLLLTTKRKHIPHSIFQSALKQQRD